MKTATNAAPAVDLETTRRIDLSPADWAAPAWRERPVLPRPAVKPFDIAACAARVARVRTNTYGWKWDWSTADIPHFMTSEEAHFWLKAMTQCSKHIEPAQLAAKLATEPSPAINGDQALELISKRQTTLTAEVLLPLMNLMSIEELVECLAAVVVRQPGGTTFSAMPWHHTAEMIDGFEGYVLPYLTEPRRLKLRQFVTPMISSCKWPASDYSRPSTAFFFAAMLKMPDALLPVVRSWKDDLYGKPGWDHSHYHQPQRLVLALGTPALVESEMRRLRLPLNTAAYIRGWLAATEYAGLDYARDQILAIANRDVCETLLETFALVKAPEAAPHMLQLKMSSKAPKIARAWLDANVGRTVAGLIPVAGGRGALADAAIEHLRELKAGGHLEFIRCVAGDAPSERLRKEVIDAIEERLTPLNAQTTPAWLAEAMGTPDSAKSDTTKRSSPKPPKFPDWLKPQTLPPLAIGGHRLNDAQTAAVLAALRKSSFDAPAPILAGLREHATAESRDAFAWRLFEAWSAEGCPSKDKWAMAAIGHLGGDACVLKLTPLIRNWPGESQHQRAVFGLDCLRAVGGDTALMQLNGIAQKLKFKGLKAKAMEFMDAIAAQRGMSRTELEDRVVPDCDLDEKGTRIFDFGPRQFRFVLGPDMKAMIKDAAGKVKSDLPAPGAKDDPVKSAESVAQWKLLKKHVKEIAKIQAERLEQAMVTGRRWKVDEFQTLLVRHPLMINLVRLIVWAGYDESGAPKLTFRVTDEQTYADERDEEISLAGVARVGVIHPLHLTASQRQAWGELFSDYEIVPPFEQIGRPTYALEPAEQSATRLVRWNDIKIPATALVGTLERLGWVRGAPQDAGIFYEHTKSFPGADATAIVQYADGVPVGYVEGWEDQKFTKCYFIRGTFKPNGHPWNAEAIGLSSVDPVAISEVIKDVMLVASKGK